jgi:cytochrome oxidase assembly protein ShyY1
MNGSIGRARPRRGVLVPSLFTLVLLVVLLGLGKWQLDRKVWKEGLIDALNQRLAAAPSALPPPESWASLDAADDEFRRVRVTAELVPGEEALVFTSGSPLRPDVSGPGYWVFAPARLPGGGEIVIDRGFVPEGLQDPGKRSAGELKGAIELVGVMRWPEAAGWFTPPPDPAHNLWFLRDQRLMAAAKHWGEVAPFYIDLEGPEPPGGLPRPGSLEVHLPDDHLQYAITWFGLAAGVAASFGFWLRARLANSE